ncbi:MAG: response regulator [Zetaproteobacteria bacterium]|nr:MAG: response regulator [Zetaproteobacteria bacterium]
MANILLAEDDKSMLNFLVLALERAGHNVTAKQSGLDASHELNKGTDFDLLLTDIVMPGLDGLELAQKATEVYPNIKIMFITGFAAMAIRSDSDETPENAKTMSKPFHLNDLVEQVTNILSGKLT